MVTMWRAEEYSDSVSPIEVVAETARFVTVRARSWGGEGEEFDRRERKDGRIFDTFEEAKEALVEDGKRRVRNAKAEWQREKDRLKKRNDIKAPVDGPID